MPTVLRVGPYCLYRLRPVQLARNVGYAAHELRSIERLVLQHQDELWEAWHGDFGAARG
jgi:hypothetical protein